MGNTMNFRRHRLPVGDDQIPVLVASEEGDPKAVFMSYESFLDLAATLYTAIEALRAAGVDPAILDGDPEASDVAEFDAWDEGFAASMNDEEETDTPHLRLVVGG